MRSPLAIEADYERWLRDPIAFFIEVLGVKPEYVWEPMVEMATSVRDNRQTAAAGCHSSSKTFTASCLAWWWVICHQPGQVVAYAPKAEQLKKTLWAQIRERYENARIPLGGKLLSLEWQFTADTFMLGTTARPDAAGGATGMQGFKSPHLFLIFEEAVGIAAGFWESARGILTFPQNRWLALANPTDPASEFARCFRRGSDWHTISISALDNPNLRAGKIVHPYLVDEDWVNMMRKSPGEGSPGWDARVEGRFPDSTINTLISMHDIQTAFGREPGNTVGLPVSIGCDMAREGDDLTVIWVVCGPEPIHCEWCQGDRVNDVPLSQHVAGRIIDLAESYGITKPQANRISIDASGGYGSGPTDLLRGNGWNINAVKFGENAYEEERWKNRRTELWVHLAKWIKKEASLSNIPEQWKRFVEDDLAGALRIWLPDGRIELEKKRDMKKRLGHSPDHGDALALAVAWRATLPRFEMPTQRPAKAKRQESFDDEEYIEDRDHPDHGAGPRRGILDDMLPRRRGISMMDD